MSSEWEEEKGSVDNFLKSLAAEEDQWWYLRDYVELNSFLSVFFVNGKGFNIFRC